MITKEELERFRQAAPKEWNAKPLDDAIEFYTYVDRYEIYLWCGSRLLPEDRFKFIGWAIEWLREQWGSATIGSATNDDRNFVVTNVWGIQSGPCSESPVEACFRAVLSVLESTKGEESS